MYEQHQLTQVDGYFISTFLLLETHVYATVVIPSAAGYASLTNNAVAISRTETQEEAEHTHRALCALFA